MSSAVFETPRLRCRRWVRSDFAPLLAVYSDATAMRWVGDGQPLTLEQCESWFEVTDANYAKRGYGMFALEEKRSDQVVGFCGLVHPGGQALPELKYAFERACWGQGLASEAAPALLSYGASAHGLLHIIATVAVGNLASQRVLTKSGMHLSHRRANEDQSETLVFVWDAANV
jgi:[ribosomal protein S5]-alanine N-acetyltransferase